MDAHYDPLAALYTFTQCVALSDISADGDNKLIIADLGTGSYTMKLKVFKGRSTVWPLCGQDSTLVVAELQTGAEYQRKINGGAVPFQAPTC